MQRLAASQFKRQHRFFTFFIPAKAKYTPVPFEENLWLRGLAKDL
jgi:hypothetical protein